MALRIRLFEESGRVRPEVAAFVAAELAALAGEGRTVTEDSAGLLAGHLLMALTRILDGEALDGRSDAAVADALAAHPEAVARARAVALRAGRDLGAALPGPEVDFLALHLAVLPGGTPASPVAAARPAGDGAPPPAVDPPQPAGALRKGTA